MPKITKIRVRQGLKDLVLYAAQELCFDSMSVLLRYDIENSKCDEWTDEHARWVIDRERYALDNDSDSSFRYRDTPWVTINAVIEPPLLAKLQREATRLNIGRDELVRASLFDNLVDRCGVPPVQRASDKERGYSLAVDVDANFIDPRHPSNRGREAEAMRRLQRLAVDPGAHEYCRVVHAKFNGFMETLITDYNRFIVRPKDKTS